MSYLPLKEVKPYTMNASMHTTCIHCATNQLSGVVQYSLPDRVLGEGDIESEQIAEAVDAALVDRPQQRILAIDITNL